MNKQKLLFWVCGVLTGFFCGFLSGKTSAEIGQKDVKNQDRSNRTRKTNKDKQEFLRAESKHLYFQLNPVWSC